MMGADTVKASLTEDLVNELYPLALDEHNLVPLFKPEFDMDTETLRTTSRSPSPPPSM